MLARPLVAAAVLLTTAAVGVVAAPGTSATSPSRAATTVFGPVALPPTPGPLVDRPVLGLPSGWRLAVAPRPLGPTAVPVEVGPPRRVGPGSSPARVRAVQRLLNAAGAQLRIDGAWGPATTRAVEVVQLRAGLPVNGRADAPTVAYLRAPS